MWGGMIMISLTVAATVKPEKRKEFLDAMRAQQQERLQEPGIVRSQLYEREEEPLRLLIVDDWDKDEDLLRYIGKEDFRILLGALRVLCTEAEVKFNPLRR
jgi:quinol monooxygenase YgiN